MGEGRHKLLERLDGEPLLRRSAKALLASPLDEVIIVLGAREDEMRAALEGLPLRIVTAAEWRLGMAHSLRAGLQAASGQADAVLVALADMPGIDAQLIARLLAGFDPEEGREIIRPVAASGPPGQPVLFGRRFFEALLALSGDNGARSVLAEHPEFVTDIAVADPRQLADLDTPEAWSAWRRGSVLL
ncbi:MAG: nucleotidyltransferase family protein [Neomegalonema sp.]|nr:nucleotidyltransferase family protein [Neomegalonema sp.]